MNIIYSWWNRFRIFPPKKDTIDFPWYCSLTRILAHNDRFMMVATILLTTVTITIINQMYLLPSYHHYHGNLVDDGDGTVVIIWCIFLVGIPQMLRRRCGSHRSFGRHNVTDQFGRAKAFLRKPKHQGLDPRKDWHQTKWAVSDLDFPHPPQFL